MANCRDDWFYTERSETVRFSSNTFDPLNEVVLKFRDFRIIVKDYHGNMKNLLVLINFLK